MPSNRKGKFTAAPGTQSATTLFCLFDVLPSCGRCRGCRAKHQKLKTGSDQSPGDKKSEAESEQSKLEICHFATHFGVFAVALFIN